MRSYLLIMLALVTVSFFSCKNPVGPEDSSQSLKQIDAPQFIPPPGLYPAAQKVSMNSSTQGAIIRYTLDGSEPSETNGNMYTAPIDIVANTTLKAIAFKSGMNDSSISDGEYLFQHPPIVLDPSPGNYTTNQTVSISGIQLGFEVKYTTDNSDPSSTNGIDYAGPFGLDHTSTVKICIFKKEWNELVVTGGRWTPLFRQKIGKLKL